MEVRGPITRSMMPSQLPNRSGHGIAQAVSLRLLNTAARVRSRLSPCGICSEQSGTGTGISLELFGFLPLLHVHSRIILG
jgi:hypothetical protein